ncbi:MAG: hypothetical protein J6S97_00915 [Bacteroidales bacterium]|nr:hypothetical protein [Bacteroidales bacterium]
MKSIKRLAFFAAIAASLSLCSISCNKAISPEEQQKQKEEKASKFWDVVGQLVSPFDITTDYEGKYFEPTIGTPSPEDPLTRVVSTNSLRAAVDRFNYLTGSSITTNTTSNTWSDPDVGTLTWNKTADGTSWATVDVNIPQLPRLKKIVYQSAEQGNDNGYFDGKAYYRFGDVVMRTVNGQEEYWICVRPCFGKEDKEKSHWVCVNYLPEGEDGNVFKYDSENWTGHFWLPTEVGTNGEHMQNFAELLYAICFPDEWETNVSNYSTEGFFGPDGLLFFHDFHRSNLKYHNKYFWKNVQDAWISKGIDKKALNLTGLDAIKNKLKTDGVTLLHDGYSWWTWWDDDLKLYQTSYTNGSSNEEKNLHHSEYKAIEKNVKGIAKIDCRKMGSNLDDYNAFFGDNKIRWVIRHAEGDDLSVNGEHGAQQPLTGVTEVYRYYKDVYPVNNLNDLEGPEETQPKGSSKDNAAVGNFIGKDGNFYSNIQAAKQNGGAAAVVVYVGAAGSVEKGKDYKGLAVSLQDVSGYAWQKAVDTGHQCSVTIYNSETRTPDPTTILDGLACTEKMAGGCNSLGHDHPSAKYCLYSFDAIPENVRSQKGLSNWFIPSLGQWILAMKYAGLSYDTQNNRFSAGVETVNKKFISDEEYFGFTTDSFSQTSTLDAADNGHTNYYGVFFQSENYNSSDLDWKRIKFTTSAQRTVSTIRFRPFIAF